MKSKVYSNFLGDELVKRGIITEQQLKEALEFQKQNISGSKKGLLGQTLVTLGYCTEEDIAKVMASRTGLSYLSLSSMPINMRAANTITPEIADRYKLLPVGFNENKLLVAMMNPADIIAIDDLKLITGYDIQPVVVPDSELKAAIEQFCNTNINFDKEDEEQEQDVEIDEYIEKPAVQLANQILSQSVKAGASDIHIEPQEKKLRIRYRIDGVLHEIMQQPLSIHPALVSRIKVMANMDIAERRIPQDGRITMKLDGRVIDVRVASMPSVYGEKITMRVLDRSSKMITLPELGFTPDQLQRFYNIVNKPYGFILITGPTGSGKSTTLYATLAELNSVDKNIITLEDPIECRMEGLTQVQVNVKAGITFASGLRAILRSDPDIIMVGEIRDHETARISVESAMTGHLVLSTLHTNDSAGAVTRLADMEIEPYLTVSSLIGVVAQRLARVLCPNCKIKYRIGVNELKSSLPDFPIDENETSVELYKPGECMECNGTGYKGRIGIFEILEVTDNIRKMILNRASTADIMKAAVSEGMITMR